MANPADRIGLDRIGLVWNGFVFGAMVDRDSKMWKNEYRDWNHCTSQIHWFWDLKVCVQTRRGAKKENCHIGTRSLISLFLCFVFFWFLCDTVRTVYIYYWCQKWKLDGSCLDAFYAFVLTVAVCIQIFCKYKSYVITIICISSSLHANGKVNPSTFHARIAQCTHASKKISPF